jgi:uncharacterized membrane protein YbhN (UPF0104 family)
MENTSNYSLIEDRAEDATEIAVSAPRSKKNLFGLQFIAFILGLGLLSLLLYKLGFKTIVDTISQIGWGFFIIVAFNGTRHFLRALCIFLAIPAAQRKFKYHHCLMARLGGEAVSFLSFTGPLLGEATKALLLKRNTATLQESVSAIVADTAIYYISVLFVIFTGALTLLFYISNVPNITYMLFVVIFGTIMILAGVLYLRKKEFRLASSIIGWLGRFSWFPKSVSNKIGAFEEVEKSFHDLYANRRRTFFALMGLDFLAHLTSILEVYVALYLLGFSYTIVNSFIIEALTKVINLVFSFVPGTFGVYEGGNELILRTLGYAAVTGITLGLVRKGASIFWIVIGFLVLIWRTFANRFLEKPRTAE